MMHKENISSFEAFASCAASAQSCLAAPIGEQYKLLVCIVQLKKTDRPTTRYCAGPLSAPLRVVEF
uniref:hypothetical protein n=1 Tax=Candidatus Electronema sp. TaxID=2698783 RepID=UPI0040573721